MKKQLGLLVIAALFSFGPATAQGGGGQRMSPEERAKATLEQMAPLKLDEGAKAKVEAILLESNKEGQKAMMEIRESGGDREEMMARRKELGEARDKKLKEVLTEAQMKQWKEEIEPANRPQRGGGGGK